MPDLRQRQTLARQQLVQQSMSAHVRMAEDRIDELLEAGQIDAALVEVAGMREAASLIERRIAIAVASQLLVALPHRVSP